MAQPHIIFDDLSLDIVEEVLNNELLCHQLPHHLYPHVWIQEKRHHLVKRWAHCETVAWNIPVRVSTISVLLHILHQWYVKYYVLLKTHAHLKFTLSTQIISVSIPCFILFSNNAWFDRPFNLYIVYLINQLSTFCRSNFFLTICTWHATLK